MMYRGASAVGRATGAGPCNVIRGDPSFARGQSLAASCSAITRPAGLHPLMAFEALNFVDGQRSYADIYRAVAAEADAAGEWYYGVVTIEDVTAYLDSAVKAGVLAVEDRQ